MAPATTEASGATTMAPATTEGSTGTSAPVPDYSAISGTLIGSGSSAQAAAMQAWQAGFQALAPGATVEYDPVGSGGGREAFLAGGDSNFAGSDAFLSDEELTTSMDRCAGDQGAIDLPHYVSPIAITYNVPDLEGTQLRLSPETVAKIFTSEITNWNDAAIAADNPGVTLPDLALNAVAPLRQVGHDAELHRLHEQDRAPTSGPSARSRTGTATALVAVRAPTRLRCRRRVGAGEGSIGYADESQIGDLPAALVGVGSEYVAPSAEAAAKVLDISPSGRGPRRVRLRLRPRA